MKLRPEFLLGLGPHSRAHARHATEYRELDLYDRAKRLSFRERSEPESPASVTTRIAAARFAQHALDDLLAAREPALSEGVTSWQRYLALPRATRIDKMVAEVFRIMRILRIALAHPSGHCDLRNGLVELSCTFQRCALSLSLTETGLDLLVGFIDYFLQASDGFSLPYSAAYHERMLGQYFTDIVAEIKTFADEDRILYQFMHPAFFNRHFRYDCDNPRVHWHDDHCELELNALHKNPLLFPIDFWIIDHERLHIVPVEVLRDGRLPLAELPRWRARTQDGQRLPSSFRSRFVRQRMIVGQPMT
ncbi:MAG: hypothetical protein ABW321_11115 [Polyangiales bacterium]